MKLPILLFGLWALLFQGFGTLAQSASDGISVSIPEVPNPPKLFNDYVGVVSSTEASDLEAEMVRMKDSTTVQIAVVVVPTVGQYDIADYAQQLATKWGIGQKSKNNGVLLVLAMNDRKSRIQVGYGLEDVLTDIQTSHIQDKVLKPLMRQEQYATAISETVNAIFQAAKGEYIAEGPVVEEPRREKNSLGVMILIFCVVFIGVILLAIFGRTDGSGGNSSWSDNSYRSSSSSWGSSSSSSGSSFSGFGGGSFGGGGSSGSW